MTITAINFATETSSAAVNAARRTIKDFYRPDVVSNDRGDWNAAFNAILPSTDQLSASQRWSVSRDIYTLLNNPDDLITEYLTTGAWSGQLDPALGRLWLDEPGTTPATAAGQLIRRITHRAGTITHTTFASGQAPVLGRHPMRGIVNRLPNNRGDGAVVGVVGSGGALPTGWFTSNMPGGTVSVVTLADKNGRPRQQIRLNGTPTGSVVGIFFAPNTAIVAANGQTWTTSAWVQQVAGSQTNISAIRIQVDERDAAGALLAASSVDFASTAADDLRRQIPRTMASASTGRVSGSVQLVTSGAIDITLDISGPQVELAGTASALQVTGATGFDVTEAGGTDCWYVAPDGLDDFGTLSAAFSPAGAYTLAAAVNVPGGALFPIFGRIAGSAQFGTTIGSNVQIIFGGANLRQWSSAVTGRQTLVGRVRGTADYDMRRSGTGLAEDTGAAAGNIFPVVNPFDALFRNGATYAPAGTRLYAYLLDASSLADARRNALERTLAGYSGATIA
jgi:hypothetical protein